MSCRFAVPGALGCRTLACPGASAVLLILLLAAGGCSRGPQAVARYPLRFQEAGPACASGTCGLQAAEFATIRLPAAISLDPRDAAAARIGDGRQRIVTRLTRRGFSPAVIVLQKGVPAELEIRSGTEMQGLTLILPVYSASVRLEGEATVLELAPEFDFTAALQGRPEQLYIRVLEEVVGGSAREAAGVAKRYVELVRQLPER
jgi:hypothetical protein